MTSGFSIRGAAALCAIFFAGCISPYTKATETFASSTLEGVGAFQSAAGSAAGICARRAELNFLQRRLGDQPFGSSPKRSEWFDDKTVGPLPGTSWNGYCAAIEKSGDGVKKICAGLSSYAAALKGSEEGAKVDADKLAAAAKDAGALAAQILPANSNAASAGATMAGEVNAAVAPLTSLATLVEGLVADKKVRDSVKLTDPALQELLKHLVNYSQAVTDEALALQSDTRSLLDWMDAKFRDSHPDPLRAAEYSNYAQAAERRAKNELKLQEKYRAAVTGLMSAHDALARCIEQPVNLKTIESTLAANQSRVAEAVSDIQSLVKLQGGTP